MTPENTCSTLVPDFPGRSGHAKNAPFSIIFDQFTQNFQHIPTLPYIDTFRVFNFKKTPTWVGHNRPAII